MASLFGREEPRIWTPSLRELTPDTTRGFQFIAFCEQVLGISLFPWQKFLALHALELLADGTPRFRTVVLLTARQSGKSSFLQMLSLFRLYMDKVPPLVIGTAQNLDIAEVMWRGAVEMAKGVPDLADEIENVRLDSGKKALELISGASYKVQPASRRGGRGLTGDFVILDELREHQSFDAWAAVTKTTISKPNAQVWAASNAGDAASIVLRHLRKLAHKALGDPDGINAGASGAVLALDDYEDDEADYSLGIFEWSAKPGTSVMDRGGWAQANPSLGYTISEKAIASAARTDPEWVMRMEVLCQWLETSMDGPFPTGVWENPADREDNPGCLDSLSRRRKKSPIAVGVDTSWDRSTTFVAMAGWRKDGLIHVEVMVQRAGTDWVVPWIAERVKKLNIQSVAFQANGAPVSSLTDEATLADVPFKPWAGSDLIRGTGMFYDRVRDRTVRHLVQPALDIAAATAVTKPSGDSWLWDRKNSPSDISPLIAVTAAVWALLGDEDIFESAYASEDHDLILL